MSTSRLHSNIGSIFIIATSVFLAACGGGSENTVSLAQQGPGLGNITPPPVNGGTPNPVSGLTYLALQSVDTDGNVSSNPPQISTTASSGQTITLAWQSPVTNSDGSCLDDLQAYRLSYGSASGVYTYSVDIPLNDVRLSCTNSSVHACGNVQTCQYNVTL